MPKKLLISILLIALLLPSCLCVASASEDPSITSGASSEADPAPDPAPPSDADTVPDHYVMIVFILSLIAGLIIGQAFSFWKW